MPRPRLLLAPGASGSIERLAPYAALLRAGDIEVELVALPRGTAERAVATYRAAFERQAGRVFTGGHSFGGRVASLLAAEAPPAGLVLLSYPLHAPGRQATWERRTAHWPRIECPVLLLAGESDPFARVDLLRLAAGRLADATLVTYPGQGHTLVPVRGDAMDRVMDFVRAVIARQAAAET